VIFISIYWVRTW